MRVNRAPAKVNLYLGVHSERDDRGYHKVDSVMAEVGLANTVQVRASDALRVVYEPELPFVFERTTAYRAAVALADACGFEPDVCVQVTRCIPVQAGLGGASSDAAAVLRSLCELHGIDAQSPEVQRVAKSIGADVPFFLFGGCAYLAGGGDELRERFEPSPLAGMPIVLVRAPGDGVPTPAAYAEFDRVQPKAGPLEPLLAALRAGNAEQAVACLSNNLEPVACSLNAPCDEALSWLAAQPGVRRAMVSGSGSAVFGITESSSAASDIADSARAKGWWAHATALA